jgi:phosphoribosylformimino-5-aminoimidazole carboxamide ribotide isomerase
MKVIPAIDLLDGQVVRLHKGSYQEVTVYNESAFEQAKLFAEAGFDHIHIVDLNGAREGRFINLPHIKKINSELGMKIQTGGGVRSFLDVEVLLNAGIEKVISSSMAVKNPDDWYKALDLYPEHCILGMDLKDGKVAYAGWLETLDAGLDDFLKPMIEAGLRDVLCTDISRDGTLTGPNVELYVELDKRFPSINWIASGGISSMEDLETLRSKGLEAAVVGKAYYEGKITLQEMHELNSVQT